MTVLYDWTEYISRLFSYHRYHFAESRFQQFQAKILLILLRNKMKVLALFAIFVTIAYVSGASVPQVVYDGPIYELKPIEGGNEGAEMPTTEDSTDLEPIRHRRVTCDLLSMQTQWFSVNHSACAIRCLAQRRRGGRCQNGVCVCRK